MIEDYDNTMVDLVWERPSSDGGRPITHYIIEIRDKINSDWREAVVTKDDTLKARVPDLKEGTVYQFRVRGVNKGGIGEPSEPTDNHLCKHRNRKFIHRSRLSKHHPSRS